MGWIGYITSIGNIKSCYKILVENLKGKHKSGDQAVDGTILLNTVFNKQLECNSNGVHATRSGRGPVVGYCGHGNEARGSEVLDQLSDLEPDTGLSCNLATTVSDLSRNNA
jgi:hypothetical protein